MGKTLAGDRGIEWSFVMERLPAGTGLVFDFGPMSAAQMSQFALAQGYQVVACGLEDLDILPLSGLTYIKGDFLYVEVPYLFDWVINTSTTEHVGLTRYGDARAVDGDLQAMAKIRSLMKPGARQLLTVPVGMDAVVGEYHRVYGERRLPRLLDGYRILEEKYWVKAEDDSAWLPVDKERALREVPGMLPVTNILELSYGLGGFVLCCR